MDNATFQAFVKEGIESLPVWVQEKLVNVAFFVRENVSKRQRRDNNLSTDETLFGLYEGVPLSEREGEPPLLPDTITIFKQPILATFSIEEDIRECVMNTVWHEVAHFIGHDEHWVEEEERKRGKIK